MHHQLSVLQDSAEAQKLSREYCEIRRTTLDAPGQKGSDADYI